MIDIKGDRIRLRSMTREEFHQARQDYVPDPMMDPNPYAYDRERSDARYDLLTEREAWYPEVGIFLPDGRIIGQLSFKRVDQEKKRCELGIVLSNDAHKGKGYGTEAFALALAYAFGPLGLDRVYADTMGSNERMQRILSRLGFHCYLRLEECYDMHDRFEDRLDYVIAREDWLKREGDGLRRPRT